MKILVLAGGKGTRISSVLKDIPKILAPVGRQTFLDVLVDFLASQKCVSEVVLSTGHLASKVRDYCAARSFGIPVRVIEEPEPMGTGGAVLYAMEKDNLGSRFLVRNGDCWLNADYGALLSLHERNHAEATLLLATVKDPRRYGTVLTEGDRVTAFLEKTGQPLTSTINAGVYCLEAEALKRFPMRPCSIETDIFPALVQRKSVYAMKSPGAFLDFGTPETYAELESFIASQ
jgi:NDP-sugar pyrophosphorylase family protein